MPDSYDDDEPQTRLSSAFIVVLILHVVAVGGIYAFNSIKAHRKAREGTVAAASPTVVKTPQSTPAAAPAREERSAVAPQSNEEAAGPSTALSAPVPKRNPRNAAVATPKPATSNKSTTPTTYVVAKGDNLVGIARKLRVSYAELLKLNNIEDPNKLQTGRSLKLPQTKKTN